MSDEAKTKLKPLACVDCRPNMPGREIVPGQVYWCVICRNTWAHVERPKVPIVLGPPKKPMKVIRIVDQATSDEFWGKLGRDDKPKEATP